MLRIDSSKKAQARKQAGFVVTVELLLITTILGLGLITGFTKVRDQVLAELADTGSAVGAINQSYNVKGTNWIVNTITVAQVSGFAFQDQSDPVNISDVGGDNNRIVYLAAPVPSTGSSGVSEAGNGGGINAN